MAKTNFFFTTQKNIPQYFICPIPAWSYQTNKNIQRFVLFIYELYDYNIFENLLFVTKWFLGPKLIDFYPTPPSLAFSSITGQLPHKLWPYVFFLSIYIIICIFLVDVKVFFLKHKINDLSKFYFEKKNKGSVR